MPRFVCCETDDYFDEEPCELYTTSCATAAGAAIEYVDEALLPWHANHDYANSFGVVVRRCKLQKGQTVITDEPMRFCVEVETFVSAGNVQPLEIEKISETTST